MNLNQALEQNQTATPQLILANKILHLSSVDLVEAVDRELAENPLLERLETPQPGFDQALTAPRAESHLTRLSDGMVSREYRAGGEPNDAISRQVADLPLSDYLLQQARLSLSAADLPIAAYLIANLDDHGFLCCEPSDVAVRFGADSTRVQRIISTIQKLDPIGIGARDARECLLIQLEQLGKENSEHRLARAIISDHWGALATQPLDKIARAAQTTSDKVGLALQFIKDNLNPFPAHTHWASSHQPALQDSAIFPRPDVVIYQNSTDPASAKYWIELPGEMAYQLRISSSYHQAMEQLGQGAPPLASEDLREWELLYSRARLFIKSIEQRWRTLRELMGHLLVYQRDFVAYGDRHLKPLTRAQLAALMDVHESTVSRAVAGKYVQLPNGRIVSLSKFFDRSAPVKAIIKDLIAQESKALSDREIAESLAQRGFPIARRTVTKYRNALQILPASLRKRSDWRQNKARRVPR